MLLLLAGLSSRAAEPPPGLSFVGLEGDTWRLFVVGTDGRLVQVPTESEPRTPAYSRDGQWVAYISASGEVRELELRSGEDRVLLSPGGEATYTQPAYGPRAGELYVVALKEGNSVDTDIALVGRRTAYARTVVTQRSAQFEPHLSEDGRFLFYSSVACTLECGKIIQELWVRDLLTGESEQLTLLNGIARQPFQARDGAIYFSSNRAGGYHIWRLARRGAQPEPLTQGAVTDEAPVVDGAGNVFFIRRQRTGTTLMKRFNTGKLEAVTLPRALKDIKDLRVGP